MNRNDELIKYSLCPHDYTANVSKVNPRYVLLTLIRTGGLIVTDHLWINKPRYFNHSAGDIISFNASVIRYKKGYKLKINGKESNGR